VFSFYLLFEVSDAGVDPLELENLAVCFLLLLRGNLWRVLPVSLGSLFLGRNLPLRLVTAEAMISQVISSQREPDVPLGYREGLVLLEVSDVLLSEDISQVRGALGLSDDDLRALLLLLEEVYSLLGRRQSAGTLKVFFRVLAPLGRTHCIVTSFQ